MQSSDLHASALPHKCVFTYRKMSMLGAVHKYHERTNHTFLRMDGWSFRDCLFQGWTYFIMLYSNQLYILFLTLLPQGIISSRKCCLKASYIIVFTGVVLLLVLSSFSNRAPYNSLCLVRNLLHIHRPFSKPWVSLGLQRRYCPPV